MKAVKQKLVIGLVIALTSQVYWNFFIEGFRVSTAVILLPVLLLTLAKNQLPARVCAFVAVFIFVFRTVSELVGGGSFFAAINGAVPGALFYLCYGVLFGILLKNRRTASLPRLFAVIFCCDAASNLVEFAVQTCFRSSDGLGRVVCSLLGIALLRALLATLALLGERQYRALLTRAEHEIRYQKLFLMTTGLKNEVYFMRKNTEEIETVMGNAYRLYEQLSDMENVPPETQKIALSIARDVHEIKKDYIRIIQGLENEMVEQYDESEMSAADLVRILEESTARMIEEHGWSIRLDFAVADDFATKKHYALMAILKNLISNGLEAINAAQRAGTLCLAEQKAGENYRFTVSDTGCGILKKDLDRIFRMGFSTKFDEKSGNIYRGVGLPGVKMTLEEQFGGSITVESVCGEGTMFCIEIPAQRIAVPKAGQNQKG